MLDELRELYQEVILDHGRSPRNFGPLDGANRKGHGHNPLCGDKLDVHVKLTDGVVEDVKFEGAGCAISTASASMMTEAIKGKPIAEVEKLFEGAKLAGLRSRSVSNGDMGISRKRQRPNLRATLQRRMAGENR